MGMKLYIWKGVLCDYTCGIIVVMAESIDQARLVALKRAGECMDENAFSAENVRAEDVPRAIIVEPEIHEGPFAAWVGGGGQ